MALTNEEITYFKKGIEALFKKKPSKNKALSYINNDSSNEEVINNLNKFLKKDFITAASSAGIKTPNSLMPLGSGDVTKVHDFVGCHSDHGVANNKKNINEAVEDLSEDINIINSKIKSHDNSINNLHDILHISNTAEAVEIDSINAKADTALNTLGTSTYKITGEPKIVTSCKRINKVYELGKIIAKGDPSIIGILKAFFDCSNWTNNKTIDHYFTITGDTSGCSPLLPNELVFSECIGALGISIDSIYASAQSGS